MGENDLRTKLEPPFGNHRLHTLGLEFWECLQLNYVIARKLIPPALFCVTCVCRDLRLFHVELREIYVTPEKIILGEFFCN